MTNDQLQERIDLLETVKELETEIGGRYDNHDLEERVRLLEEILELDGKIAKYSNDDVEERFRLCGFL